VCICVLNYCHRVTTQLQLNMYHIIYHNYITMHGAENIKIPLSHFQAIFLHFLYVRHSGEQTVKYGLLF
jgi:hypothetical protein